MKIFTIDSKIAYPALEILSDLASGNPECKIRLGELGACELFMTAIPHGDFRRAEICRPFVRALAYGNLSNKNKLLYLGAADYVPVLNVSGWLDGEESEQGGDY